MKFKSVNPYTEEVNWTYDSFSLEECEAHIKNSRAAFSMWSALPVEERTKYLVRIAEVLRKNTDLYAEIITKEMGKPITQAIAEIQKCTWLCDYYAEKAPEFLKDEVVDTGSEKCAQLCDYYAKNAAEFLKDPLPATAEVQEQGKAIFSIYCVHCHGQNGMGDGPVAGKLPGPPPASSTFTPTGR